MAFKGRKSANKNPPFFSHEFFIQNHADILSCVTLVIVVGVMIQATSPVASLFLTVQHNVTTPVAPGENIVNFTNGWKDICTISFYVLISIVIHAIILEYILDKISRKLHLSKIRHSQFNESGQLFIFYAFSILWGADIIVRENYITNIAALWEGYPHVAMNAYFKFFFIIQLAYWLHSYPELYFQKVKREDMAPRIKQASASLIFIALAYITNYNRVGLCLTVLHYISESVQHLTLLVDLFRRDDDGTQVGALVSKILFVFVRLATIILSVLTFWYGLSLSETQGLNISTGNFNTFVIRMGALAAIGLLQAYLMWNFITSQLARIREASGATSPVEVQPKKKIEKKGRKEGKAHDEVNDLPEVDQNTAKRGLKARTRAK